MHVQSGRRCNHGNWHESAVLHRRSVALRVGSPHGPSESPRGFRHRRRIPCVAELGAAAHGHRRRRVVAGRPGAAGDAGDGADPRRAAPVRRRAARPVHLGSPHRAARLPRLPGDGVPLRPHRRRGLHAAHRARRHRRGDVRLRALPRRRRGALAHRRAEGERADDEGLPLAAVRLRPGAPRRQPARAAGARRGRRLHDAALGGGRRVRLPPPAAPGARRGAPAGAAHREAGRARVTPSAGACRAPSRRATAARASPPGRPSPARRPASSRRAGPPACARGSAARSPSA